MATRSSPLARPSTHSSFSRDSGTAWSLAAWATVCMRARLKGESLPAASSEAWMAVSCSLACLAAPLLARRPALASLTSSTFRNHLSQLLST
eukprot:scaffold105262_cov42-Phaeocystis_antarctica.AAC.1